MGQEPNKELESENVNELSYKEHTDVPIKIYDKNIPTSKNDEKVTTKVEHPYVNKTEFPRLRDDNFDLVHQLQKTVKENSNWQVIIKLQQEDKTRGFKKFSQSHICKQHRCSKNFDWKTLVRDFKMKIFDMK